MIFTDLTDNDRRDIIDYASGKTGFLRNVVEKDRWVTSVLRAIFSLPYADNVSFKGLCIAIHNPLKDINEKKRVIDKAFKVIVTHQSFSIASCGSPFLAEVISKTVLRSSSLSCCQCFIMSEVLVFVQSFESTQEQVASLLPNEGLTWFQ